MGVINYHKFLVDRCNLLFLLFISLSSFRAYSDFEYSYEDPLELSQEEILNEKSDELSIKARNLATEIRRLAISEINKRRKKLADDGDNEELKQFEDLLRQGNFVFKNEIGIAEVTMVEEDYAVKITLDEKKFPFTRGTVFVVFDLLSLRPDPKRVAFLLSVLEKRGLSSGYEIEDIKTNPEKLDAFIIDAGLRIGIDPIEIKRWLNSGSFEMRQYISRLILSSDTQAIGINGEEIVFALFGKKPKFMTKKYWRTWFSAVKALPSSGSVMLGFVCGTIQGVATYWMAKEALMINGTMADSAWIPFAAAAWSFSYGFTISTFNTIYRNIVYRGSTPKRVMKLTVFGAVFSYVYKALTDPLKLLMVSEELHIWSNMIINQYAKDDAYRIARIRDDLGLSNGKIVFTLPNWIKRFFPSLMKRVGNKVELEQADFETQASYHGLWTLKMLHFVHLLPVAVLPFAIVLARGCTYGYLGYLYTKFSFQYRKAPTEEKLRQLDAIRLHLKELNHSWLDIIVVPYKIFSSAFSNLRKSKEKSRSPVPCLQAYKGLNIEPSLPIEI